MKQTPDKMKILYHHRTQGKGVEGTHIRGIVHAFERAGHEVHIISPPGVAVEGVDNSELPPSGINTRKFWGFISRCTPQALFEIMELLYNITAAPKIKKLLRAGSFELIYERYSLYNLAGIMAGIKMGVPVFLEVNDATIIRRSRPLFFRSLARLIEKWIFLHATLVITISEKLSQLILENYPVPENKIVIAPNAVDPERICGLEKTLDSKNHSPFTIGMVAAFVPWHGTTFLMESIAEFLKNTDSRLLLVGDGPERQAIQESIINLNLDDHVLLTGAVPANVVAKYIAEMDVCVMADSNEHGSPMKIFEYMASKKPVVAPDYGPIREIIGNKETGLIFEPHSSQSLLNAIQMLFEDSDLRLELGRSAMKTIIEKHTWDHRLEKILHQYWESQPASHRDN